MKLYASLLPFILLAFWPSCESNADKQVEQVASDTFTAEASLRWTGMIAADGCGFYITIGETEYKAINEEVIPVSYTQHDSSRVNITYQVLEEPLEYNCGMVPGTRSISSIKLLEVKPH